MPGPVDILGVAASALLVAVAVGLSRWQRMGIEATLLWASARALIQLLAVGIVLAWVIRSSFSWPLAWLWVASMVGIASETVHRRAANVPRLRVPAALAIGGATAITLLLVFIPAVVDLEPVTLVVIAGITIGNTMPSTVLAVDQVKQYAGDRAGEIEALMALGFDAAGATRFMAARSARTALIPQIERTKVVGLIALPGAMTGLLLAGVDPFDAVLAQLVIMYVLLGSVATSVVVVTLVIVRRTLTPDLRVADWTRHTE